MKGLRLRTSRASTQDDGAKRLFGFALKHTEGISGVYEEYFFSQDEGRKHRFDFALPALGLGIEINGGIWNQGAHGRPAMILRNMEKLNLATALGWRVLSFSTDQVKTGHALAFTLATIERLGRQLQCQSITTSSPIGSKMPFLTPLPCADGARRRKSGLRSASAAWLDSRS